MVKEEFIGVLHRMKTCGLSATREQMANGELPLWEEVETVMNALLWSIMIIGRSGKQAYVMDDHKAHCMVNPSKHKNMNVRFTKHKADNRVGTVIDKVYCRALSSTSLPNCWRHSRRLVISSTTAS